MGVVVFSKIAFAESRYETTVVTNGVADIAITEWETGQIVYLDPFKDGISYYVLKNQQQLWNIKGSPTEGTIIRGPAIFRTVATPNLNNPPPYNYSAMTVKITPVSFDPNKAALLPPGTNQMAVSLETSTNLLHWTLATNGIYGSPDTVRFFRIKMTAP